MRFRAILPFLLCLPNCFCWLQAQQLIALQLNGEGHLVARIERPCKWNPASPSFLKELSFRTDTTCNDTIIKESIWYASTQKTVLPLRKECTCPEKMQLLDRSLFGASDELINSKDVYDFVNTPSDVQNWQQIDPHTWQLRSYLSNPYTRDVNDLLITDRLNRVKELKQFNQHNEVQYQLNYYYTTNNLVEHTTHYYYHYDYVFTPPSIQKSEVQTVWVYDKQQRVIMMMRYNGRYRPFTNTDVNKYKVELSKVLKKEGRSNKEFDSLDIREVLLYNYGPFGIESVLRCQQEVAGEFFPHYYERRYLSDSVYYDSKGRIIKCITHQNQRDEKKELLLDYNVATGQIEHTSGYRIQRGNWFNEDLVEQWFEFKQQGKISYSRVERFRRTYKRPAPNQIIAPPTFENSQDDWYEW